MSISYESIRKIMKEKTDLHVSRGAIIKLTQYLEQHTEEIAKKALEEFIEENKHRKIQGEAAIKRLSEECIKRAIDDN